MINDLIKDGKRVLALLIDPDKHNKESLIDTIKTAECEPGPDIILVGGSIIFNSIDDTVKIIKSITSKPIYLFPGSALHISEYADGILLLSLISGRNPDFLIGNHVLSSHKIKKSGLRVTPTGYMLINTGIDTSVSYISNTTPIPYDKDNIAVATALAGEMLGLKMIYLEAGSGALKPVSFKMINEVKKSIKIPLIVGGGIKTSAQLKEVLKAGADVVVIGTAIENDTNLINDFAKIVKQF
jgi:putative glycerol-1-phosphate prenyltransferase